MFRGAEVIMAVWIVSAVSIAAVAFLLWVLVKILRESDVNCTANIVFRLDGSEAMAWYAEPRIPDALTTETLSIEGTRPLARPSASGS
jgi:hypothetical protein